MEFTTHLELHSQATRLFESVPYAHGVRGTDGILTLSDVLFQGTSPRAVAGTASPDYNSERTRHSDFQPELFPLHSPLLRESQLVSFPPLNYMLKFSGSSCLISGQKV